MVFLEVNIFLNKLHDLGELDLHSQSSPVLLHRLQVLNRKRVGGFLFLLLLAMILLSALFMLTCLDSTVLY